MKVFIVKMSVLALERGDLVMALSLSFYLVIRLLIPNLKPLILSNFTTFHRQFLPCH